MLEKLNEIKGKGYSVLTITIESEQELNDVIEFIAATPVPETDSNTICLMM